MKIGDIVKSLDFNGVDDCYWVGEVVGISALYGDFRAKFIERVWQGEVDKKFKTDYFTAPCQGNLIRDSEDSPRVIVVG